MNTPTFLGKVVADFRNEGVKRLGQIPDKGLAAFMFWIESQSLSMMEDLASIDEPLASAKMRGAIEFAQSLSLGLHSELTSRRENEAAAKEQDDE